VLFESRLLPAAHDIFRFSPFRCGGTIN
jgi:hypothetical protein